MDLKTGVALMRNSSFAFFAEGGNRLYESSKIFLDLDISYNFNDNIFLGPIYKEMEDTFYEEEKCGINEIEYLEIVEPYYALKKNSPLREIMKTK